MQICRASVDRSPGYIVIRSWLVQVGWFYVFCCCCLLIYRESQLLQWTKIASLHPIGYPNPLLYYSKIDVNVHIIYDNPVILMFNPFTPKAPYRAHKGSKNLSRLRSHHFLPRKATCILKL